VQSIKMKDPNEQASPVPVNQVHKLPTRPASIRRPPRARLVLWAFRPNILLASSVTRGQPLSAVLVHARDIDVEKGAREEAEADRAVAKPFQGQQLAKITPRSLERKT